MTNGKLCLHIALNILRCNEDAEECENDTYLKTWNSIPPDDPMCLRAYVSRIVRNLVLSKVSAHDTVVSAIQTFLSTQDLTVRALFIQRYFYMESISALSKKFGEQRQAFP